MRPDDYQKIKQIFNSAVEIPPEGRGAFLDERCDGDGDLRKEVERLLDSMDDEFLERPASQPFSDSAGLNNTSRSGQRINHYEVIRRIGSGGMGDVYLAVDGKLGRQVAIKILPDEFTTDANRLDRFQLEARSASSLSHPNILTIFEVGEWQGTHYIATEYVEGETLRQRLSRERLSIGESMDLGIQLASGIAAAHEASICHRDIKPENIMIRRDGLLKVVDFGLAKLVASPFRSSSSPTMNDEPTVKIINTEPGVVMGTVQYMSPEQTRALPTDERSDIWSLGCVLYEMLTGHSPFKGDTSADMVAEIMKTHPELPSRLATDVPERLDEIIGKSLEKNPDERYQTAKDLLIDLKRLKRNLELEDTLERSNPSLRTEPVTAVTSGPNIISTKKGPKDLTEVNSAEYLYWGIKAHRWTTIGITLFVMGLIGGTAMLVRIYWHRTQIIEQPVIKNATTERLTGDGKTAQAVVSADRKFLAYVKNDSGEQSIWVKQISTNSSIKLVPEGLFDSFDGGLTFTPDGSLIYFSATIGSTGIGSIYSVPTLGGSRVKVLPNGVSPSFSSDGSRLAVSRPNFSPQGVESKLVVANRNGADEREVAILPIGQVCIHASLSPDGNRISCAVIGSDKSSILIIDVIGGTITEMPNAMSLFVLNTVWLPDMSALIVSGSSSGEGTSLQIWEVPIADGAPRRLTDNLNSYSGLTMTSDGKTIVSVENDFRSGIWVSPSADVKSVRSITSGKGRYPGISWTPDGQIVYVTNVSGAFELWRMRSDGTDAIQLTNDRRAKDSPVVSQDGRFIVYAASDPEGHIWKLNAEGGSPGELTNGKNEQTPDISPDSKWILYTAWTSGKSAIWRVPSDGGEAEQITSLHSMHGPRVSPDGKHIAVMMVQDNSEKISIGIVPFEGGAPVKEFDVRQSIDMSFSAQWTPDGKGLVYIDGPRGFGNLWLQPTSGGKPSRLTDYKENGVWHREWSLDGKHIALVRGEASSDAIMVTNFR